MACSPAGGSAAGSNPVPTNLPTPTLTGPEHVVVTIGDSILFNSPDDCPGCTSAVSMYANALTVGRETKYVSRNLSRHDGANTAMLLEQVESGTLDVALESASIVIVSAGFNDQAPFGSTSACFLPDANPDTAEGAAAALAVTTPECFAAQNAATGETLRSLLAGLRTRAPEAVILAVTSYDAWTGWPDVVALGAEKADLVSARVVEGLDSWRTIVCAEVAAVGGECVDLFAVFNGPDGGRASGDLLAADYTHPSQLGNDRIRDALLAVEG